MGELELIRGLADLGATALLIAAVFAFMTGRVVSGVYHQRQIDTYEARLAQHRADMVAVQARLDTTSVQMAQLVTQQSVIIEQALPALRAYKGAAT